MPLTPPRLLCFSFQVHQPYRLRDIRITDIGTMPVDQYFDVDRNRAIFRKVAEKCYLPANATVHSSLVRTALPVKSATCSCSRDTLPT